MTPEFLALRGCIHFGLFLISFYLGSLRSKKKAVPLCRSSIRGYQSEIMFGVLEVVFGCDPIARLEFSLGQCHVSVIVSSRVVRVAWLLPRRTRCPPLSSASK